MNDFWANMMNMFFTNRNTIEFRLHGPSCNVHKIVNWMLICTAIIKYAEAHALEIITMKEAKISLKDVLYIFPEMNVRDVKANSISDYLYAYFEHRKKVFASDIKNGDGISMWDIEQDEEYEFEYNGIRGLV